jgi:hypothetical protein
VGGGLCLRQRQRRQRLSKLRHEPLLQLAVGLVVPPVLNVGARAVPLGFPSDLSHRLGDEVRSVAQRELLVDDGPGGVDDNIRCP